MNAQSNSYGFWVCHDYLHWEALAVAAQVLFALRFLWQWDASERRKESIVPPAFWYFSLAAGLALAVYAAVRDPVILVSAAPSVAIYARNIVLIQKTHSKTWLNLIVGSGLVIAVCALLGSELLVGWYARQANEFWLANDGKAWVAFGFVAQCVFFMRFVWQWIVSESRGECVIPVGFWYFSLVGGSMLSVYAVFRDPFIFPGQIAGLAIYARNLVLIHRSKTAKPTVGIQPPAQSDAIVRRHAA